MLSKSLTQYPRVARATRNDIKLRKIQCSAKRADSSTMALELKRICVYCGASMGNKPEYQEAATELGRQMVSQGTTCSM